MEVLPHEGLHGVEVRFLPLLQLGQALFQLLSLCIIKTVLLSRSDPCVNLFTLRYKEVFLRIFFGLLLVHHLLPEPLCLSQDFLNHGFITEYGELQDQAFKVED
ncbi:hypothetical protein D3C72_1456520 [compost metagenome]